MAMAKRCGVQGRQVHGGVRFKAYVVRKVLILYSIRRIRRKRTHTCKIKRDL